MYFVLRSITWFDNPRYLKALSFLTNSNTTIDDGYMFTIQESQLKDCPISMTGGWDLFGHQFGSLLTDPSAKASHELWGLHRPLKSLLTRLAAVLMCGRGRQRKLVDSLGFDDFVPVFICVGLGSSPRLDI